MIIFRSVAEAVGGLKAVTPTGASILVEGKLVKAPENAKQVSTSICGFAGQGLLGSPLGSGSKCCAAKRPRTPCR